MSRLGVAAAVAGAMALAGGVGAWTRPPAPAESRPALALDGASLFEAKGCATCHTGPDTASVAGGFPSLADAGLWAGERRPPMSAADYLGESIREPWAFRSPEFGAAQGPVTAMPALGLTEAEIDAVVAYLLRS